jgi:hypothetical protein
MYQKIDISSISKFVRRKDLWNEQDSRYSRLEDLLENYPEISPSILSFSNEGEIIVSTDLVTKLILRKINAIICNIYKVKQANRNAIVNNLKHLLQDGTPKMIIKTDIRAFYESIDVASLLDKLMRDKIVSFNVMEYLHEILKNRSIGLPRGVNISASLSELYMRDFDAKIKSLNNVGYYARYVDDIIIVFFISEFSNHSQIQEELNEKMKLLQSAIEKLKLQINSIKTNAFYISKSGKSFLQFVYMNGSYQEVKQQEQYICFDYLGYRYLLKYIAGKTPGFQLNITIAIKKINKMKSRIYYSFLLFGYDNNFTMLINRIKYLFSNHLVHDDNDEKLYAGIYYNYQYCDQDGNFLNTLDSFYRKLLKQYQQKLSTDQYKILKEISAVAGFKKKIIVGFTHSELETIMAGINHYE